MLIRKSIPALRILVTALITQNSVFLSLFLHTRVEINESSNWGVKSEGWIKQVQNRVHWGALLNKVMGFAFQLRNCQFVNNYAPLIKLSLYLQM
jgi:hypothetical protein